MRKIILIPAITFTFGLLSTGCSTPVRTTSNFTNHPSEIAIRIMDRTESAKGILTKGNLATSLEPIHKDIMNKYCSYDKKSDIEILSRDTKGCFAAVNSIANAILFQQVAKKWNDSNKNIVENLPLLHAAINLFGKMYSDLWMMGINNEVNSQSLNKYGEANASDMVLNSNETIALASKIQSDLGIISLVNGIENEILKQAKNSEKKEFLDLAVKFHTTVDLNFFPKGSLAEYRKQLQDARLKLEEAGTLLSITNLQMNNLSNKKRK
jgi:hypothetical protein